MALCSHNLTLGIVVDSKSINKYSLIKDNHLIGSIGEYFDRLYVQKGLRKCEFKGFEASEMRKNNIPFKTFLSNNTIDVYLDPKAIEVSEENIEIR